MKTGFQLKEVLPHIISVLLIFGSISMYFGPQYNGKTVAGGDVVSSTAWSKQVIDYKEQTGETSNWNPSMFSGMPWGLLSLGHQYNLVKGLDSVVKFWTKPPMGLVLKSALICYLALLLLGISPYLSLIGALIFAFNVNYIILIEAGHQSKLNVIANFPLILAGLILCYRQKWKLGAPAIALATSIAISNNHIQMVYYLLLCLVVFSIPYLIYSVKEKKTKIFLSMAAIALGVSMIGALSNFSVLYSSKSFSEDTMRGKPILEKSISNATSSSTEEGLDWNYAMQWSNGLKDLGAVIIPRFVGGSSAEEISANTPAGKLLRSNNASRGSDNTYQAPMYWGDLPFTAGSAYCSIVLVGLFILGLFAAPPRLRWALLGTTVFLLFLSMGKNASWLNRPLFDFLPLLSKFRAPNSAITILPLFLVLGAVLGLHKIIRVKKKKKYIKPALYSFGSMIVISLLFAIMGPSMFDFDSVGDQRYGAEVTKVFKETRIEIFRKDAWRSVLLSGLGFVIVIAYLKRYFKSELVLIILIGVLIIGDQINVDRRYLDRDNWESASEYKNNFALRSVDQQILNAEPKGRGYYRVFDIPNLQTAIGSYHHNTIGGYHAAKLQRYEDMLSHHIYKNNLGVLNMLNAKYFISQDGKLQVNSQALGSAWCVSELKFVDTANDEIASLTGFDPSKLAVIHKKDFPNAEGIHTGSGPCKIELVDYKLNRQVYNFESQEEQFVVFSEIWYDTDKGLTAWIDGVEVDHFRVNYTLRGLQVPAGKHEVVYEFKPEAKGASISMIASIIIILMLVAMVLQSFGLLERMKRSKT